MANKRNIEKNHHKDAQKKKNLHNQTISNKAIKIQYE
jgi:hypothetical protein